MGIKKKIVLFLCPTFIMLLFLVVYKQNSKGEATINFPALLNIDLTLTKNQVPRKNDTLGLKFINCSQSEFKKMSKLAINTEQKEVLQYVNSKCKANNEICANDNLVGALYANKKSVSLKWLYENEFNYVHLGGWWAPTQCRENQQTAIIIPFRNREEHLPILLRQLLPILKRQKIHFRIFVIEQSDDSSFNRAKLMNVGYSVSQKFFPYPCFVFHDVDLIPEDDRIDYACKSSPAHLSAAVDVFSYHLPYSNIFGGVEMFKKEDLESINGFPNSFWIWGGEDDNLFERTRVAKMKLHRQPEHILRYTMIVHKENLFKDEKYDTGRSKFLAESLNHFHNDGLNTLQYEVLSTVEERLYTHIKVDLRKNRDKVFFTV